MKKYIARRRIAYAICAAWGYVCMLAGQEKPRAAARVARKEVRCAQTRERRRPAEAIHVPQTTTNPTHNVMPETELIERDQDGATFCLNVCFVRRVSVLKRI